MVNTCIKKGEHHVDVAGEKMGLDVKAMYKFSVVSCARWLKNTVLLSFVSI